jgi:hypothetical protein
MYKIQNLEGRTIAILRLADMASIPLNPDNTDYIAYLKWLEEGNTPEPAEQS